MTEATKDAKREKSVSVSRTRDEVAEAENDEIQASMRDDLPSTASVEHRADKRAKQEDSDKKAAEKEEARRRRQHNDALRQRYFLALEQGEPENEARKLLDGILPGELQRFDREQGDLSRDNRGKLIDLKRVNSKLETAEDDIEDIWSWQAKSDQRQIAMQAQIDEMSQNSAATAYLFKDKQCSVQQFRSALKWLEGTFLWHKLVTNIIPGKPTRVVLYHPNVVQTLNNLITKEIPKAKYGPVMWAVVNAPSNVKMQEQQSYKMHSALQKFSKLGNNELVLCKPRPRHDQEDMDSDGWCIYHQPAERPIISMQYDHKKMEQMLRIDTKALMVANLTRAELNGAIALMPDFYHLKQLDSMQTPLHIRGRAYVGHASNPKSGEILTHRYYNEGPKITVSKEVADAAKLVGLTLKTEEVEEETHISGAETPIPKAEGELDSTALVSESTGTATASYAAVTTTAPPTTAATAGEAPTVPPLGPPAPVIHPLPPKPPAPAISPSALPKSLRNTNLEKTWPDTRTMTPEMARQEAYRRSQESNFTPEMAENYRNARPDPKKISRNHRGSLGNRDKKGGKGGKSSRMDNGQKGKGRRIDDAAEEEEDWYGDDYYGDDWDSKGSKGSHKGGGHKGSKYSSYDSYGPTYSHSYARSRRVW